MLVSVIALLACASLNMANEMAGVDDFNTMRFQDIVSTFQIFVQNYNRSYKDANETIMRLNVFSESLKKIVAMNEKAGKDVFGITEFADYTQEEMDVMLPVLEKSGYSDCQSNVVKESPVGYELPETVDWRNQGVVTGVKAQFQCGSCWAFATIGAVEGAHAINFQQLVSLSEQQLVDCNTENQGCHGGLPDRALSYVINNGVASEEDYPYVSREESDVFPCKADSVSSAVQISSCVAHQIQSEDGLMQVLAENGPITLTISFGEELRHYKGGVLENCPANELNHVVLLIGYGNDEMGTPYWLIKNSHGTGWGEDGYFRVKRNVNACNMTSSDSCQAVA